MTTPRSAVDLGGTRIRGSLAIRTARGVSGILSGRARASVPTLRRDMRVHRIDTIPIHTLPYRAARAGGGVASWELPILRGTVDALPPALDALVVTSDLQGVADLEGRGVLLGVALASALDDLARAGALPPTSRTGVLLCGDLYSAPGADVRGASGDVRAVWRAFARVFRWVAGVYGNHDTFGDDPRWAADAGVDVLDGAAVVRDGLRVAGIGGIVGDPRKPRRKSPREFTRMARAILRERPDVLLLHGPPEVDGRRGSADVRHALDRSGPVLVACGHAHWSEPLADVRGGAQALNVDARVVILGR